MPVYFFNLKTAQGEIRDPDGTQSADEPTAKEHARQVARELMKWREPQSCSWRIVVRDNDGRQCFELLFASVDDSIATLGPELRCLIENVHRKQALLNDAIAAVRLSLMQIKATIARSNGRSYLAAVGGVSIAAGERTHRDSYDDGDVIVTAECPETADNFRCWHAPTGARNYLKHHRSVGRRLSPDRGRVLLSRGRFST